MNYSDNEFIKLNRKIKNWRWFCDVNTAHFFIYCLLSANWKDGYFKDKKVERGQFIRTYANMSAESGLSVQNIRTAIKHLISTQEITVNLTGNGRGATLVITVVKYDEYQQTNMKDNTFPNNQLTTNQHESNNQSTQIEEDKNERSKEVKKELSNDNSISDSQQDDVKRPYQDLVDQWNSLSDYKIKTIRSIRGKRLISLRARLKEHGKDSFAECIEQIKQSRFLQTSNFFDFDWLVCETNYPKVLEGKYNDNSKKESGQASFNMGEFLKRYEE